jgi:hypothetical protein
MTLNQRVQGSSPCAPTIQLIEIESEFLERTFHRLMLFGFRFQRGSKTRARKNFQQGVWLRLGQPPGYMDRPPPQGRVLARDPAKLQPVKTKGISKVSFERRATCVLSYSSNDSAKLR